MTAMPTQWKLVDPENPTTVLPVWSQPFTNDEELDPENQDLCEHQSDEDECSADHHYTGVEGDTWIVLCGKHLRATVTPVSNDEYAALVADMLRG